VTSVACDILPYKRLHDPPCTPLFKLTRCPELVDGEAELLQDAKPADLPFEQPTQLELVIDIEDCARAWLTISRDFPLAAGDVVEWTPWTAKMYFGREAPGMPPGRFLPTISPYATLRNDHSYATL
jgi:hypothetical protein